MCESKKARLWGGASTGGPLAPGSETSYLPSPVVCEPARSVRKSIRRTRIFTTSWPGTLALPTAAASGAGVRPISPSEKASSDPSRKSPARRSGTPRTGTHRPASFFRIPRRPPGCMKASPVTRPACCARFHASSRRRVCGCLATAVESARCRRSVENEGAAGAGAAKSVSTAPALHQREGRAQRGRGPNPFRDRPINAGRPLETSAQGKLLHPVQLGSGVLVLGLGDAREVDAKDLVAEAEPVCGIGDRAVGVVHVSAAQGHAHIVGRVRQLAAAVPDGLAVAAPHGTAGVAN